MAGHDGSDSPGESMWASHPGEEPGSMRMLLHRSLFTVDETGHCKAMDLVDKLVDEALADNFRATSGDPEPDRRRPQDWRAGGQQRFGAYRAEREHGPKDSRSLP